MQSAFGEDRLHDGVVCASQIAGRDKTEDCLFGRVARRFLESGGEARGFGGVDGALCGQQEGALNGGYDGLDPYRGECALEPFYLGVSK